MTSPSDDTGDASGVTLSVFPGGKLPAQPARPQLRAASFLDTNLLPDPPDTRDWLTSIPTWPMYGNDEWGDCVFAGIGHHEQQISTLGQGAEVRVSDATVLDAYSQVTGFNPADPSTDQGTYVQDAMAWWRRTGMAGHQILAYTSIDPSDVRLVKQCIDVFGAVGVGFNFPRSAMSQFNAGQPWDVVSGSPIEGGHYVLAGAYDPAYWRVVTWARVQKMTPAFWSKYVDEVWVPIDDEMVNRLTSKSFSTGVDLAAFAAAFTALTGEPVPVPVPPTPSPAPGEPATAADRTLIGKVGAWADRNAVCGRSVRRAIREWRDVKDW